MGKLLNLSEGGFIASALTLTDRTADTPKTEEMFSKRQLPAPFQGLWKTDGLDGGWAMF